MKLQRIEIANFRCFKNFSLDVGGNSIYLLGENASGKTSLINAISKALGQDRAFSFDDFHDPSAAIEIVLTVSDFDTPQKAALSDSITFGAQQQLRVGVRVSWDAANESVDILHGFPGTAWKRSTPDQRKVLAIIWLFSSRDPDKLLSFFVSNSIVRRLTHASPIPAAASKTAQAIEPISAGLGTDPEMRKLLDAAAKRLSSLIPGVNAGAFGVELSVLTERDLLKELAILLDYGGSKLRVPDQSSGLGQLSIFSFALELASNSSNALILVDEPEISIHPHAQRALVRALRKLENQSIIATHSSNILERVDPRKVARLHRRANDVVAVTPRGLQDRDAVALARYSTPETAEAFFARKVIF